MNNLDIILLLLVLVSGIISGIRKGFVYQAVAIIGLLAAVYVSYTFSSALSEKLATLVELQPNVMNIASFVICFLAVYALFYLASLVLKKIVNAILGGWIDRLLGAIFSTLKLFIILGLIVMLFDSLNGTFGFVSQEKMDQSVMYIYIKQFSEVVFPYLKALISEGMAA